MKIAIIGGGSIGLLFTYYLCQNHHVVLYVRTARQQDKLQKEGLILQRHEQTFKENVEVRLVSEWGKDNEDLSIICVKQYQLPDLLAQAHLSTNHPLLFVQNGMGHLKHLEQLKTRMLLVGSVEHGAYRLNEHCVAHTGIGRTRIAVYRGDATELVKNFSMSVPSTFPLQIEKDYKEMLLSKLVVNAVINPLTAILKVENGILLENPHYFKLVQALFAEVAAVLQLENAALHFESVQNICKNTAKNRSSMLKDLEAGNETEVDAILGYLLEEAEEKQLNAPLISSFYHCIKGSELARKGK